MTAFPATPGTWDEPLERAADALRAGRHEAALAAVIGTLRSGGHDAASLRAEQLAVRLESRPELAHGLGEAMVTILANVHVLSTLTEAGVPSAKGFLAELGDRLGARVLPELDDPGDLRVLVRRLFPEHDDHVWVEAVPTASWTRILTALGIRAEHVVGVSPELASAIRVLAHHVSSQGLKPEITRRLPHLGTEDSPFLRLSDDVLRYLRSFDNRIEGDEIPLLDDVLGTVGRCRAEVERLRAEKANYGTSLHLTGRSYRLLRLLARLELLLHLTEPVQRDFQLSAVRLFKEVVRAENTRHDILPPIRERTDLLAFQVVEHAARKGSKYITTGRRDYTRFFLSSLAGGLFVATFALMKVVMEQWPLAPAAGALLYGINYTLCFVLIYLTGATLATKQPAMTANTIAQALGRRNDRHIDELVELVVRVWRSQFVSFAGNLFMAFPVAFALSELYLLATGDPVADPGYARGMLADLHPWRSGTLAFAAVAGACLFGAGLIAGWFDNRNVLRRIPERVAVHPILLATLGADRSASVGRFVDRNLGMLAGNTFLGFALGSMGTVGEIVGLPIDIRHVAFASAHFGTALEVLDLQVAWSILWPVGLAIVMIGLINFVASFGLSLVTALESRRITWKETRVLLRLLGQRAITRPIDWFVPPRAPLGGTFNSGEPL